MSTSAVIEEIKLRRPGVHLPEGRSSAFYAGWLHELRRVDGDDYERDEGGRFAEKGGGSAGGKNEKSGKSEKGFAQRFKEALPAAKKAEERASDLAAFADEVHQSLLDEDGEHGKPKEAMDRLREARDEAQALIGAARREYDRASQDPKTGKGGVIPKDAEGSEREVYSALSRAEKALSRILKVMAMWKR